MNVGEVKINKHHLYFEKVIIDWVLNYYEKPWTDESNLMGYEFYCFSMFGYKETNLYAKSYGLGLYYRRLFG